MISCSTADDEHKSPKGIEVRGKENVRQAEESHERSSTHSREEHNHQADSAFIDWAQQG